jgi:anti-anti-sigma factor
MRTVVRVFSGKYDLAHQRQLRAEFDAICEEPNLILDMRGVTYMDSTCITELLRLHNCRNEKGIGPVSIVRNTFIVKRLFGILYFRTLFHLVETLKEVLPTDGSRVVVQYACRGDQSELLAQPVLDAKIEASEVGWEWLGPLWSMDTRLEPTH